MDWACKYRERVRDSGQEEAEEEKGEDDELISPRRNVNNYFCCNKRRLVYCRNVISHSRAAKAGQVIWKATKVGI